MITDPTDEGGMSSLSGQWVQARGKGKLLEYEFFRYSIASVWLWSGLVLCAGPALGTGLLYVLRVIFLATTEHIRNTITSLRVFTQATHTIPSTLYTFSLFPLLTWSQRKQGTHKTSDEPGSQSQILESCHH